MKAYVVIDGTRYPRFGWSYCDGCGRSRVLFYTTPKAPGVARCERCIRDAVPSSGVAGEGQNDG